MAFLDRNAKQPLRVRRNMQRMKTADFTGNIQVDQNGGLSSAPDGLRISKLTTKGDLLTFSTVVDRLPVGTNGQLLTADSAQATGLIWSDPPETSPLTTKGDIFVFDTDNTRLPVGSNGQLLTANSGNPFGLEWVEPALMEDGIIFGETPSGTVNGVNTAFTTANTPATDKIEVFVNGQRQTEGSGNDYTVSGSTITFTAGSIPQTGDLVRVNYVVDAATGSSAQVDIRQTEIDFGSTPVESGTFTVNDTTVSASSLIVGSVAYDAPTGKDLDELELDALDLKFGQCGSGTFQIFARGLEGYVEGKFKINYQVG